MEAVIWWLAPTWRVVGAAVALIVWRWQAVQARAAELVTASQRDAFAYACATDFALVWALALVWRMAAHGCDAWSWPIATASRATTWACALVAIASPIVRAGDYVHCYLAHSHLSAEAATYLGDGFGDAAFTPRWLWATLLAGATSWLVVRLLVRDAALVADEVSLLPTVQQRLGAFGSAALASLLVGAMLVPLALDPPHEYSLSIVPEANLVYQLQVLAEDPAARPNTLPQVTPERWRKWQNWGFVPTASRQAEPFPLYQPQLNEPPLALPRKPGVTLQPNVVVVMLESTSSLFVSELSGFYKGLMPELSALSRRMTRVQPYYNTSSPTIAGTIATLCSVFPPHHPADVKALAGSNESTNFSCLSEILHAKGYRNFYIAGHDPHQANTEEFLRHHGFDEIHTEPQLNQRFGKKTPKNWFGFHDAEVYTYAMEQIERLEAARTEDGRPYFMVIATLDAHEPGLAPKEFKLPTDPTLAVAGAPKDAGAQTLLKGYHFADRAMGPLAKFLFEDGRAARTLIAITADHAPFRTPANASVFKGKPAGWSYTPLPLLVHDPAHDLPKIVEVLAGSLDVAPTLLHLLGVVDVPHSLTGHSIFGSRPQLPLLLGRTGSRGIWLITPLDNREEPMGFVQEACRTGVPLLARDPKAPGTCDLLALLQWQDAVWSAKRLRPQLPIGL